MKILQQAITKTNQYYFDEWSKEFGEYTDFEYYSHPDTNAPLGIINGGELTNGDEYKDYLEEHKEEVAEFLLEQVAEIMYRDEQFKNALFQKFLKNAEVVE